MDLGPFTETDDEAQTVCGGREADFSGSQSAGERDSPAKVIGERNFCGSRSLGSGSSAPGIFDREQVFPQISESSLAFQRSCGSLGPFTEKDDEASGISSGSPTSEIRPRAERDCPARAQKFSNGGSPGRGIVLSMSYRERNFRPPGLREAGFSSSVGIFPSLSKKLWIIGSLHREGRRSPDAPQNVGKRVSASHQDFPRCRGAGSGIPPPGAERIFAGSGFQ